MTFANDMSSYWMPFTANRQFRTEPRLLLAAEGMHYTTIDGRRILDGTAGLWCSNAGHTHPKIVSAIQRSAACLDYSPAFQVGHPDAFAVASTIAGLMPGDLNHVFFCNSGSEAVDTALKMALAYHRARGDGQRTRLIGRERGYHGVGFGGISVGGIVANRKSFGTLLAGVDHLRHTHDPVRNAFSRGLPEHGAELADDLERLVALHDASTIAAVIVEPVACSTGVLPPPVGYLHRLREICDRHGILLIFDEVITAFGRLGLGSAAERFGVTPDLMTMAKGLTNGAVPMGAVACASKIHEAIVHNASADGIEFFHGYTYSAHPLACAAALATLEVYREEALFERVASLEPGWQAAVHSLRGARHVIDIRNIGLIGAVELEPTPIGRPARGFEAFRKCFERGLLIRVTGDIVALSPPFIVEPRQITEMLETLADVLQTID